MSTPPPGLVAIIVAAGSSRRMGFDKLTAPLAGQPLIAHTLAAFQACEDVGQIALVAAAERQDEFRAIAAPFPKVLAVVPGGRERVESVLHGTAAFGDPAPLFVAVHDGARPLITPRAISACYEAARQYGAAVSAEPVTDTLHRVDDEGVATETVSRKNLWRMQTPQVVELSVLRELLTGVHESGGTITDEISLVLRSGGRARVVENPEMNLKVTYPRDLALAEMILRERK